ncbi:hypothetical protein KC957_01555 [Candidatus Saccharibacteria bacterium]|nr:hypothetical protein [Candidatus Saccharibacteria bacterium]
MTDNPELLYVRARDNGRTYIGAAFCPGDQAIRMVYEDVDADVQLRIGDARRDVQQGADPQAVISDMNRLRHTQRRVLGEYLANIAAGNCLVYPVQ